MMMKIRNVIATLILFAVSAQVNSEGWSILGNHDDLKGYSVVDVGVVTELIPPYGVKWNTSIFKLKTHCFSHSNYSLDISAGAAAILLVNAQSTTKLATFQTDSIDINVKLYSIQMYECPSMESYINGNNQQLEDVIKKMERIKKEIEAAQ